MALTANQGIALGVSSPKKAAVVGTGVPTVGTNAMGIFIGSTVVVSGPQSVVGQFDILFRYAKSNMKALTGTPCVLHVALTENYSDIVMNGVSGNAPGNADIRLIIGAGVHGGDRSHFLNRTFKRLIEVLLERNK
jgi:hypothetical protein